MRPKKLLCCTPDEAPVICSVRAAIFLQRRNRRQVLRETNRNPRAGGTMFNSVRSRLTVWYAAVLTCSLLLLSVVIYFIVKESVLARMDAGLVELSDSFLATLEAELKDAPSAEGVTGAARQSMLEHQYPAHSFAVLTASGDLVADSSDLPSAAPQTRVDLNPKISAAILEACIASLATPAKAFHTFPGKHGGARCYARTFSATGNSYRLVILASLHPESELLGHIHRAWLADSLHHRARLCGRLFPRAQKPCSRRGHDVRGGPHRRVHNPRPPSHSESAR